MRTRHDEWRLRKLDAIGTPRVTGVCRVFRFSRRISSLHRSSDIVEDVGLRMDHFFAEHSHSARNGRQEQPGVGRDNEENQQGAESEGREQIKRPSHTTSH